MNSAFNTRYSTLKEECFVMSYYDMWEVWIFNLNCRSLNIENLENIHMGNMYKLILFYQIFIKNQVDTVDNVIFYIHQTFLNILLYLNFESHR